MDGCSISGLCELVGVPQKRTRVFLRSHDGTRTLPCGMQLTNIAEQDSSDVQFARNAGKHTVLMAFYLAHVMLHTQSTF